jgi:hypothetical protein
MPTVAVLDPGTALDAMCSELLSVLSSCQDWETALVGWIVGGAGGECKAGGRQIMLIRSHGNRRSMAMETAATE